MCRLTSAAWCAALLAACGGGDGPPAPDADYAPDPAWPASTAIPLARGALGSFYSADVTIGGTTFALAVDTGSTTTGVAAAACRDCNDVTPVYAPGATAVDAHATASAAYADGSRWSGEIYSDDVGLADGTPSERISLVAIDSGPGFFRDPSAEGILGLGPNDLLDAATTSYAADAARTASGQIGFELCDDTGTMWIGTPDVAAGVLPPDMTPMLPRTAADPYYEIAIADLGLGDTSLGFDASALGHAVVDTGTTNFYVPAPVLAALVTAVDDTPGLAPLFGSGALSASDPSACLVGESVTSDRVDAALPPLAVTFPIAGGDGTFTARVPATRSYLAETSSGTFCLAVGDQSGGPSLLLGDTFLRGFVTVIDPRAQLVGFAVDAGCQSAALPAGAQSRPSPRICGQATRAAPAIATAAASPGRPRGCGRSGDPTMSWIRAACCGVSLPVVSLPCVANHAWYATATPSPHALSWHAHISSISGNSVSSLRSVSVLHPPSAATIATARSPRMRPSCSFHEGRANRRGDQRDGEPTRGASSRTFSATRISSWLTSAARLRMVSIVAITSFQPTWSSKSTNTTLSIPTRMLASLPRRVFAMSASAIGCARSPSSNTNEPSFLTEIVSWIVAESRYSGSVILRGTSSVSRFIMIGITTRKMMSKTSNTSINGVTLIALCTPSLLPPLLMPMVQQ